MINNKLINKLLENWIVKVLCVVISLFLYLFYQLNTFETKNISVPLSVVANGEVIPISTLPNFVRLKLKGENKDLATIQENDIIAFVDVSTYTKTGKQEVPVQVVLSEHAVSISPLEIEVQPSVLNISLENKAIKYVALQPSFSGEVAKGFQIDSFSIEPQTIEIIGPESIVNDIDFLNTSEIKLNDLNMSKIQNIKINNFNSYIEFDENEKIYVTINISAKTATKTFNISGLLFEDVREDFSYKTNHLNFTIKINGKENDFENYTFSSENLYIDCSNIENAGSYELPVLLNLPENFSIVSIEPEKIKVEVTLKQKEKSHTETIFTEKIKELTNEEKIGEKVQ